MREWFTPKSKLVAAAAAAAAAKAAVIATRANAHRNPLPTPPSHPTVHAFNFNGHNAAEAAALPQAAQLPGTKPLGKRSVPLHCAYIGGHQPPDPDPPDPPEPPVPTTIPLPARTTTITTACITQLPPPEKSLATRTLPSNVLAPGYILLTDPTDKWALQKPTGGPAGFGHRLRGWTAQLASAFKISAVASSSEEQALVPSERQLRAAARLLAQSQQGGSNPVVSNTQNDDNFERKKVLLTCRNHMDKLWL